MNLSVIILTKNEADTIAECINSILPINPIEILVIDDDSKDDTCKIASKLGAIVISHPKRNFADARNYGLQKSKGSWILYLDADERLTVQLQKELLMLFSKEISFGSFGIIRINFYLGKQWPQHEIMLRLFHKERLKRWYGELHESPQVEGASGLLQSPLHHFTHRSLSEMVENTILWSKIEAELRFEAHHPPISWWRILRVMIPVFYKYYILEKGFSVGTVGLIESIYQMFSIAITYCRLWEIQILQKT